MGESATAVKKTERIHGAGAFTKQIGTTTYRVGVHFSKTNSETIDDKIIRLVRTEAAGRAANK